MEKETLLQKLRNKDPQALRFLCEMFYKSLFQAAFFKIRWIKLEIVYQLEGNISKEEAIKNSNFTVLKA
ncbi:hypothetical protein G7K71_04590 [Desulfofundulus sp. TPOSR]|uniref:hypothetical protein n=1 Tax=Desulfofundulus sp. TPOSR TaxID=2714340 RepID=UPI00140CDAB4|nr:hypothetical protein [Desulfofundulus sp. TPOSR]NHM26281.1 hypothetical protein [Desulfofundulus sp. TPOSR]